MKKRYNKTRQGRARRPKSSAILSAVKTALTEAGVLDGASGEISFVPGTYTGVAGGRGGDVVAAVTVSETAIEAIEVTGEKETIGIPSCRNSPTMASKLVVDAEGARVANEAPYNQMFFNKQLLRHASPAYYGIFDKANTAETVLADFEAFAPNEDNRVVVYADTIEALAEKIGVDPAALRATYDRYQGFCETGVDEDFGKDAANLVPYVEEDGFYAVRVYPASWGTIGGALTDDTFHVLAESGEVMQNVFAVGEVATSRLFGGFSLGFYTAAGHIAAETAVAELSAK